MYADQVMTRNVISVRAGTSVRDAIRLMVERRISGLPVVDEGNRLLGIISEGDFLYRAELGTQRERSPLMTFLRGPALPARDFVQSHARVVEDIMVRDVATVSGDAALQDVVTLMRERRVRRIPVVEGGILVGIVSRADLLRLLSQQMDAQGDVSATDVEIRDSLVEQLRRTNWFARASVRVDVVAGVVVLEGVVGSEAERRAVVVAAENAPGAKGVDDRMQIIDVMPGIM